jgi:protein-glucosylgalactosylhydroxylysine glucosidase
MSFGKNQGFLLVFLFSCQTVIAQLINRKALVERHTIINTKYDSFSSLSVGNGQFAFTVDITGLQSFPDAYAKGVPLGTQSEWGWHSFTDTANYTFEETLRNYHFNGRDVSYAVQIKEPERKKNAVNWFRQNPHRLHLGSIGFEIIKKDGTMASIGDIQNIRQSLNMYTGEIHQVCTDQRGTAKDENTIGNSYQRLEGCRQ